MAYQYSPWSKFGIYDTSNPSSFGTDFASASNGYNSNTQSAAQDSPLSGGGSSLSPFGLLGQGIQDTVNIGFAIYDRYQQKKANEQNQENWEKAFNFQKDQFDYAKYANENALQIHTADAAKAGLSPLVGLGSGGFSAVGGQSAEGQSASVSNPQIGLGDMISTLIAQQNQYNIAKMQTESAQKIARNNNETAEAIASMQAKNQSEIASYNRQTEEFIAGLKNDTERKIARDQLNELKSYHTGYLKHLNSVKDNNFTQREEQISQANRQMEQAQRQFDAQLKEAKDENDKKVAAIRYQTTMMFWSSIIRSVLSSATSLATGGISQFWQASPEDVSRPMGFGSDW